jgi:hypothetical protein
MPKRSVSWGVLLFSFALISLGYKPPTDVWSFSFDKYFVPMLSTPYIVYEILGVIAIVGSFFLVISSFWSQWSTDIENFIINKLHVVLFFVYWFVFSMGYLKAIAAISSISPPVWVNNLIGYAGYVLFLLIPALYSKWVNEQNRTKKNLVQSMKLKETKNEVEYEKNAEKPLSVSPELKSDVIEKNTPPSLDLAFDWLKDVLVDQEKTSETYNNRVMLLFSAATAILGIGIPLGLGQDFHLLKSPLSQEGWLLVVSIIAYGICSITTIVGVWPRKFLKLDNPITIREEFWDLSPEDYKTQILTHTEDAYTNNNIQLKWKTRAIYSLIFWLTIETICLVLSLALTAR